MDTIRFDAISPYHGESLHSILIPNLHAAAAAASVIGFTQAQCPKIEVALLGRAFPVESRRQDAMNRALAGDHAFGANAFSKDVHLSISKPLHGRMLLHTTQM